MIDVSSPSLHIEAMSELAISAGVLLVGGGLLLRIPAVQERCSSLAQHPKVRSSARELAAWACDRAAESLRPGGGRPFLGT